MQFSFSPDDFRVQPKGIFVKLKTVRTAMIFQQKIILSRRILGTDILFPNFTSCCSGIFRKSLKVVFHFFCFQSKMTSFNLSFSAYKSSRQHFAKGFTSQLFRNYLKRFSTKVLPKQTVSYLGKLRSKLSVEVRARLTSE